MADISPTNSSLLRQPHLHSLVQPIFRPPQQVRDHGYNVNSAAIVCKIQAIDFSNRGALLFSNDDVDPLWDTVLDNGRRPRRRTTSYSCCRGEGLEVGRWRKEGLVVGVAC
ncbi:hypothetical protein C1H46_003227 [Malus baccata]|uniref:Uncharacterized protein n=1 Tax=Malus baccata TaxID=106549 RepID=A0A540NJL1_MALBA|nr:hypothetical protein C1H46_003227 [Malus baccata]